MKFVFVASFAVLVALSAAKVVDNLGNDPDCPAETRPVAFPKAFDVSSTALFIIYRYDELKEIFMPVKR